jgi:hypothetical protein
MMKTLGSAIVEGTGPAAGVLVYALAIGGTLVAAVWLGTALNTWWTSRRGYLPCLGCYDAPGTELGLCSACAARRAPAGL